jgi:Rrf2 family protein
MIPSATCKQALRALVFLAGREGRGPTQIREISQSEGIPHPFLAKILHSLRNRGLVRSTRGPGGGYELARPADMIKIGEVMSAIDGVLNLDDVCILGLERCSDEACCALHERWKEFRESFSEAIGEASLKEAVGTLAEKRRAEATRV